jgi:FtsZ-binding cell division protein ZapB
VKDLALRFSEVERRVRALVAENRSLRAQVRELTRERDAVGSEARDAEALQEKTALVRERLQRLLARLESLEQSEGAAGGPDARRTEAAGDGHE